MNPGLHYGVPMVEYLNDPAWGQGSLRLAVEQCPAAALADRKRLREHSRAANVGSVAHAIVLEQSEACLQVIDPTQHPNKDGKGHARGWTNDSIKAARDEAIAAGLIPLLPDDVPPIRTACRAVEAFIATLRDTQPDVWQAFQPDGGRSEVTGVWDERGVACRCRWDRISNDGRVQVDLKFTERSANPARLTGQVYAMGYDFSAVHYRRGARALFGAREPRHYLLFCEQAAPHLCSLVVVDSVGLAIAEEKHDAALALVRAGEQRNVWPGYPARAIAVEPPAYLVARWQEQQAAEELAA